MPKATDVGVNNPQSSSAPLLKTCINPACSNTFEHPYGVHSTPTDPMAGTCSKLCEDTVEPAARRWVNYRDSLIES